MWYFSAILKQFEETLKYLVTYIPLRQENLHICVMKTDLLDWKHCQTGTVRWRCMQRSSKALRKKSLKLHRFQSFDSTLSTAPPQLDNREYFVSIMIVVFSLRSCYKRRKICSSFAVTKRKWLAGFSSHVLGIRAHSLQLGDLSNLPTSMPHLFDKKRLQYLTCAKTG